MRLKLVPLAAVLVACHCVDAPAGAANVSQPVSSPPAATSAEKQRPRNVLIVGDSEACAVGAVASDVANEQVPPDNVNVSCKAGSTVQYWSGLHMKHALSLYPASDVVLVFLGTNHYTSRSAPDVKPLLSELAARRLPCVWVGNVAVHGKSWPINALLKAAVSPPCSYFDSERVKLQDGVHPDRTNAKLWLRQVWAAIPRKA